MWDVNTYRFMYIISSLIGALLGFLLGVLYCDNKNKPKGGGGY